MNKRIPKKKAPAKGKPLTKAASPAKARGGRNARLTEWDRNVHNAYHADGNLHGVLTEGRVRRPASAQAQQKIKQGPEGRTHLSFAVKSYCQAEKMGQLSSELQTFIRLYKKYTGSELPNSVILRFALTEEAKIGAGVPDSNILGSDQHFTYTISNQAHHIVEAGNSRARSAMNILEAAGIDYNSAANGVLLPSEHTADTGDATIHLGSHVQEYTKSVERALEMAVKGEQPGQPSYREKVLERLAQIRRVLLTCNVPINSQVDADYDLGTNQGAEIETIFEENGLFDRL